MREKHRNKLRENERVCGEDIRFKFRRAIDKDYESWLESHNRIVVNTIYNNFEAFYNGFLQENIKCCRYMRIINAIHNLQSEKSLKDLIFEKCNEDMYDYLDAPIDDIHNLRSEKSLKELISEKCNQNTYDYLDASKE